jgi:predicted MPP superfamily phosphohydrolase
LATRRTVFLVNLTLTFFFLVNAVAIIAGLTVYPLSAHMVFVTAALGNLLWLLLPSLFRRQSSPLLRTARAVLAPLWVFWTLLILLYSVFTFVLGMAWFATRAWHGIPYADFAQWPSNLFLGSLALVVLIGALQALFLVEVVRVPLKVKGLPPAFAGFKVAMISDLHVGLFTRVARLKRFAKVAQKQDPDLFLVCGDITDDDPHFLPKFLRGLEALDPHLPAYGVLGNHDVYADPIRTLNILEDSRLRVLVNEGLEIKRDGASLWLAGVGDQGARRIGKWGAIAPDFDKALEGKPAGMVTLLMAHQPQGFRDAAQRKVELTLSGHTHGGQFGFRWLGWSLAKPFMEWHMGLFKEGDSQLYVSTGTGFWVLPVRFGLTPEITLIELHPA